MKQIKNVHVFKVGDTADSDKVERYYTLEDLQEMADTYNSETHEAPIVWGHDADKKWRSQLSRKTQLANGWIVKVYVKDKNLYVDMDVDDATYEAVKSKKLKKRSIGLYPPEAKHNPTPGKWYIRHLALLGTEPPAIKGLDDIVIFSENLVYNDMNKEDAIQQLNENASEWLALILKNDGEGFGETILEFMPKPKQDNNWLWDDEEQKYSGQLKDEAGDTYDFEILKEGDSWTTSVKMIQEDANANLEDEAEAEAEAEDVELSEKDCDCKDEGSCDCDDKSEMAEDDTSELDELKAFKEKAEAEMAEMTQMMEDLAQQNKVEKDEEPEAEAEESTELMELRRFKEQANEELAKMRKFMEERREADRKAQYNAVAQFCEGVYDDGYMTEAMMSKDILVKLLIALLDNQQMTYSDGEKDVSLFDGVKSLISNLPKRVEFSESVAGRQLNTPVVKVPKSYGEVSPESAKEYTAIKEYMERHNITNFREARKKYHESL